MKSSKLPGYLTLTLVFIIALMLGRASTKINLSYFSHKNYSYLDNPFYTEQTGYYELFDGTYDVVMFGNSLTQRMHWNELLPEYKIANRGIGSDITEGFLKRLPNVINCKPKIVFIEGGINDIVTGVSYNDFIKNVDAITTTLNANHIKVVFASIIYTSKSYKDAGDVNKKVDLFNKGIDSLSAVKSFEVLNINQKLSRDGFLGQEFAGKDGIHLQAKAYKIWKGEILKFL